MIAKVAITFRFISIVPPFTLYAKRRRLQILARHFVEAFDRRCAPIAAKVRLT
jgi:hypothetical protein